jgi:acetylornithine deacetylase/succinyl-diaminopimelate desuccinylase-like protein
MDRARIRRFVDSLWEDEIVGQLTEYIRIPNKSPLFDPQWAEHGHMDAAVALLEKWARAKLPALAGATLEVVRLPGRTPLIYIDVPAAHGGRQDDTVILYGHLDKQPEMSGWSEGLGPWTPVRQGDKLFGRGGADDGYALFGSLAALLALREQQLPQSRCVLLIEACEESGSYDLPFYVDHLKERLGTPSLAICLDSGCGNYDQLWLTTSLRGLAGGNLRVQVLQEGVHSGDASSPRASASCGSCCRASRTRPPAASSPKRSTWRSRSSGWSRRARWRKRWARPCSPSSRSWRACGPCATTSRSWC